ncbi:class I SAM-dependent methyltransferase, partial [Ralstonia pseudosolanacearum]
MCPAVVPDDPHALTAPSPWVVRWAAPLPAGAR